MCVIHAIRRVGFLFNISVGIRQWETFGRRTNARVDMCNMRVMAMWDSDSIGG
jgi:hypothetical protein